MRNWVYDFDRDLPAGVRCSFTLKTGLTAVDGSRVAGGQRFEFSTGGPAILRSLPYEGARIDENQVFILGLDAPAKRGDDRRERATAWRPASTSGSACGSSPATSARRSSTTASRSRRATCASCCSTRDTGTQPRVRVRAARDRQRRRQVPAPARRARFAAGDARVRAHAAAGAEVKLVWGKGIAAASGVATTDDQALAFEVRPAFRASFSCERVNRDAQCLPHPAADAVVHRADRARATRRGSGSSMPRARRIRRSCRERAADDGSRRRDVRPRAAREDAFRLELPPASRTTRAARSPTRASFPLKVRTDEMPPLAKFPADFGILEARAARRREAAAAGDGAQCRAARSRAAIGTLAIAPAARRRRGAADPGQVARVRAGDEMQIVDWLRRIDDGEPHRARIRREDGQMDDRSTTARSRSSRRSDRAKTDRRAEAARSKAFEVIGIPLDGAGFLRRRAREPAARRRAVRRAQAVLRAHRGAGHQSRRAFQARPRIVARLGDAARRRQAGAAMRRSACATARGNELLARQQRRFGHRAHRALRCPTRRTLPKCNADEHARSTSSPRAPATTWRSRSPIGARASARGASTSRPATTAVRSSRTPCSTARWCAPAKRCR